MRSVTAARKQLGKALPEAVIRQLDAQLHLLGPSGRAGSVRAVDLQQMQQTIYQILRDSGRRPGEVVSLVGAVELIDGQQPDLRQPQSRLDAPTEDHADTLRGYRVLHLVGKATSRPPCR